MVFSKSCLPLLCCYSTRHINVFTVAQIKFLTFPFTLTVEYDCMSVYRAELSRQRDHACLKANKQLHVAWTLNNKW